MGSTVEYVESSQIYATHYIRNSKAISVLWAIFTICYAIIAIVAFVTPEWIGDTESEYPGKFGLWSSCQTDETGEKCDGRLDEFSDIPSAIFQVATVFVGASVATAFITICAMLLFFFCPSTTVFHICGWLQLVSAVTMGGGAAVYPAGWDSPAVRRTCGPSSAAYAPGLCSVRWAYALAVVGCLDAVVLAALAFVLATRHVKLQADTSSQYMRAGSVYKGEINNAYVTDAVSVAESRKSLNLHPVLLVSQPPGGVMQHPPPPPPPLHHQNLHHHNNMMAPLPPPGGQMMHHHIQQQHPATMMMDDTYSQFSSRTATRSQHGGGGARPDYQNSMHNFQL